MKKMRLVPEAKFRQMTESEAAKSSTVLLQAINQPEQREMIKKYNQAQNIQNDESKSTDVKRVVYNEMMQDYFTMKDKVKGVRYQERNNSKVVDDTVNMMPASLKSSAEKLMNRIKENDGVISWESNGEVSIHGKKLVGSNITDLVGDVIRQTKEENLDREPFLRVLAELNTPEVLIKNKSALLQFRRMKNRNTPLYRPKGIPDHQMKSELSSMDYKETDSPMKKVRKAAAKISWANT